MLTYACTIAPYVTAGVFLIDRWRQIGVKAVHQQLELTPYFNALYTGGFDAIVDSYTDYSDDPTGGLVEFLSSDKSTASSSKFDDPVLDDLYERQSRAGDRRERPKLVRAFEKRALEEAYSVPIL